MYTSTKWQTLRRLSAASIGIWKEDPYRQVNVQCPESRQQSAGGERQRHDHELAGDLILESMIVSGKNAL